MADATDIYGRIYDADGNGKVSGTSGNDRILASNASGVDYMYGGVGNDSFEFIAKQTSADANAPGTIDKVIYDFEGAGNSGAGGQDFLHFSGYGVGSTITLNTSLGVNGVGQDFGVNGKYYYYTIHDTATGNDITLYLKSMNGQMLGVDDYNFYAPVPVPFA